MKLFKYCTIAFFVSITSFKSDAYEIRVNGMTDYVTYEPVANPNNSQFIFENPFNIEYCSNS